MPHSLCSNALSWCTHPTRHCLLLKPLKSQFSAFFPLVERACTCSIGLHIVYNGKQRRHPQHNYSCMALEGLWKDLSRAWHGMKEKKMMQSVWVHTSSAILHSSACSGRCFRTHKHTHLTSDNKFRNEIARFKNLEAEKSHRRCCCCRSVDTGSHARESFCENCKTPNTPIKIHSDFAK